MTKKRQKAKHCGENERAPKERQDVDVSYSKAWNQEWRIWSLMSIQGGSYNFSGQSAQNSIQ